MVTLAPDEYYSFVKNASIPECAFYDRLGRYIEYRPTDTSCNAAAFNFIEELRKGATYPMPDTLTLAEQLSKFRDLNGNRVTSLGEADYYVLIYWAAFIGRLNKDHVKIWEDQARNNKKCSIKVLKVNIDVQKDWPDHLKATVKAK